ncbi:MAG TPA: LutB/LldF family L-lactate oxidation iron-sulfur protein [Mycobacteriales bacterium]|nr:LutB/LldF family L-lactate oxidation iron-sulfur protein [Mycobacteriales bacterium]
MTTTWLGTPAFPDAAHTALQDAQLRRNLRRATSTIRARRATAVGEVPDWEDLRDAAQAIKDRTMRHLDRYLEQLEASVTARGGTVHWARDAGEACGVVVDLVRAVGATEVVKVKSLLTDEIHLNAGLARRGITAHETDLAELIVQLGDDRSSHILVPAIHKNRSEIRQIFAREMPSAPPDLTDEPAALAEAARRHLREKFLSAKVAVSGANFLVADTGTVCVVESEGNGRMCLTLPETLITVAGIEKLVPTWADLEVFLQVLPRSSTGERMNPYTSLWSGVTPGDGPGEFHLVLVDNGRSDVLADPTGRQALHCIRCSACLNVCPVYERVGGHAYGSVYPGPIGAILTPQMYGTAREHGDPDSLPYASSLCGACYDVCPVRINIPDVLVHLRNQATERRRSRWKPNPEATAMRWLARAFADERRYERAQRLARVGSGMVAKDGRIARLPFGLGSWTDARDAPALPEETFRQWWRRTRTAPESPPADAPEPGLPDGSDGRAQRAEPPEGRRGPQIENWMAELRDDPDETVVDLFRPASPRGQEPSSGPTPGGIGPEPTQ